MMDTETVYRLLSDLPELKKYCLECIKQDESKTDRNSICACIVAHNHIKAINEMMEILRLMLQEEYIE